MNQPRRFAGDTLVIASHNDGKVREIADLLRAYVAHFPSAGDLSLSEPEETGVTFAENAALKARAVSNGSLLPALADDSGLVVPALEGAPGIYSARWAGPQRDFRMAMARIRAELGDGDPSAHFVCALALAWPDGHVEATEGRVDGTLVFPPRGDHGFGYDPIFRPAGRDLTFGEMDQIEKHRISHRANAFRQLVARCFA